MSFKEVIKEQVKEEWNKYNSFGEKTKKRLTVLFMIEIVEIILFVMGSFILLWGYSPFVFTAKILITILASIVTYDIFKHFVYVKWTLINEMEE